MATPNLKPWYSVVQPREDLRDGRPLDASEFAVELDAIREGRAPDYYGNPALFFERTYLTRHLRELGAQVLRRLGGEKVESSPVFSLITQFGGGKTHAMAMLYHLAQGGYDAQGWAGVRELLDLAGVQKVAKARTAVFVGTFFDPTVGRTNEGVTRHTPWGEIAWQLGGAAGFEVVARHDRERIAPGGDVIRQMLPANEPVLILLDELMSFVGRHEAEKRHVGLQLYHFLQSLSEVARSSDRVVLVASLQASSGETTPDEVRDLQNFRHMFNRLGRSIILSVEDESAEIIRRRLFEWKSVDEKDVRKTASAYADALETNRALIPSWFPVDKSRDRIAASFPFHPSVLSVFERKWRSQPRFQQTRGLLRLLGLWVASAYAEGMRSGSSKDSLITLGSAPLKDPLFRAAVFDQLTDHRQLETAVTTDIVGRADSIAARLDENAEETLKKEEVHRKAATVIFFESNGGHQLNVASSPEIHLAMIEPGRDVVNVQTALESLVNRCHYLTLERASYRFNLKPNLNKLLADRRDNIKDADVDRRVRDEVREAFSSDRGAQVVLFPTEPKQIPDQPRIVFAVLPPERDANDADRRAWMEHVTQTRVYKSAVFWLLPEQTDILFEKARDLLTCQDVPGAENLSDAQQDQLRENRKRATIELRNVAWRAYSRVFYLGTEQRLTDYSLGQILPGGSDRFIDGLLLQLQAYGIVERTVSPSYLLRKWPPALTEWSTRAARDVFYQSPEYPRILNAESIRDMLARGITSGDFALVTRAPGGGYGVFRWKVTLSVADIDVNDDTYIIRNDVAEAWIKAQRANEPSGVPKGGEPVVTPPTSAGEGPPPLRDP